MSSSNPSSSDTTSIPSESHSPSSTGKLPEISWKDEGKGPFSTWSLLLLRKEHWIKMDSTSWWSWWRCTLILGNALLSFRWCQKSSAKESRILMITIGSYQASFNSPHPSSKATSLSRMKRVSPRKTGSIRIWPCLVIARNGSPRPISLSSKTWNLLKAKPRRKVCYLPWVTSLEHCTNWKEKVTSRVNCWKGFYWQEETTLSKVIEYNKSEISSLLAWRAWSMITPLRRWKSLLSIARRAISKLKVSAGWSTVTSNNQRNFTQSKGNSTIACSSTAKYCHTPINLRTHSLTKSIHCSLRTFIVASSKSTIP